MSSTKSGIRSDAQKLSEGQGELQLLDETSNLVNNDDEKGSNTDSICNEPTSIIENRRKYIKKMSDFTDSEGMRETLVMSTKTGNADHDKYVMSYLSETDITERMLKQDDEILNLKYDPSIVKTQTKSRVTRSVINKSNKPPDFSSLSIRTTGHDIEEEPSGSDSDVYGNCPPLPPSELVGTPAYQALQANADIKVSRLYKAARKTGLQSLYRGVKHILPEAKGKPPRLPFTLNSLRKIMSNSKLNKQKEEEEENIKNAAKGRIDWLKSLSAKKSRKSEIDRSYVKGKVIDDTHEKYALTIAMMIGLRTTIGRVNARLSGGENNRWLEQEDFMAVEKYLFPPKGSLKTPPHSLSHTFKFKEYSPLVFAYLRRCFGVNEFDFLKSVCGNANFIEYISNAKSGMFFFYSHDGKYMIKTMSTSESKFLRRILPHYFKHCAENPNTLMTKFYGMYRVKLYHLRRRVKFVIMNSIFDTDKHLHEFFDLKGSVLGRYAGNDESVKKDNNLRSMLPQRALALHPEVQGRTRQQLKADCDFFKRMKIMDYSMLVGIHNKPSDWETEPHFVSNVSPSSGSTRSSVEVSSFRKSINNSSRDGKLTSAFPSISLLESPGSYDGVETVVTEITGYDVKKKSKGVSPSNSILKTADQIDESSVASSVLVPAIVRDVKESEKRSSLLRSSLGPRHENYFVEDELSVATDTDDNSLLSDDGTLNSTFSAQKAAKLRKGQQQIAEKIYWPFHRLYSLHGQRRLNPYDCSIITDRIPGDTSSVENDILLPYNSVRIPDFTKPLSNRKDLGFEMDMRGLDSKKESGKIFYFGIIDILQQYNTRKRLETKWRRMQAKPGEPSCVHPNEYADRFLSFFEEYTSRNELPTVHEDENDYDGIEEITFSPASKSSKSS